MEPLTDVSNTNFLNTDVSNADIKNLNFIKMISQEEGVKEKMTENLFWEHSHKTDTNPVCHYCLDLSKLKINKIPSNLKEEAYLLYKETEEGKKYTVVDVNYDFWYKKFFEKITKGIDEADETGKAPIVKIPNGCCGHRNCPISLFYKTLTICCYQFNLSLGNEKLPSIMEENEKLPSSFA